MTNCYVHSPSTTPIASPLDIHFVPSSVHSVPVSVPDRKLSHTSLGDSSPLEAAPSSLPEDPGVWTGYNSNKPRRRVTIPHTHARRSLLHTQSVGHIRLDQVKNGQDIDESTFDGVISSDSGVAKGLKKEGERGDCRGVSNGRDEDECLAERTIPEEAQESNSTQKVDVMRDFGLQLFNCRPYDFVHRLYNNSCSREFVILASAAFFLYIGLRVILQSMCEDGGFHAIFFDSNETLVEVLRRTVIFSIRLLTVVVSPLCLVKHISVISAKPRVPETNLTHDEAISQMMKIHRRFSPHYEVKVLEQKPASVFEMSEKMTKRHINSVWMSALYSILFSSLLWYLGGVNMYTKKVTGAGICQFLIVSVIPVPFLDVDVHVLVVLDLLLSLGVLMCINILKDFYYYENRIAVYSATAGGKAEKLYKEIRRRWIGIDMYIYLMAIGLMLMSLTLSFLQRTIIPDLPSSSLQQEDFHNWFFWILVLAVYSFLGKSSKRLVKKASVLVYIIAVVVTSMVDLRIDTIPPETLDVFLFLTLVDLVLNLLLSLCSCHFHHFQCTRQKASLALFLLSVSLAFLLVLFVLWTIYREASHLATFVAWNE